MNSPIEYNFDDEERVAENAEQAPPEFSPEYFWAFAAMLLYYQGGSMAIPLENLKQFNAAEDSPQVFWDKEKKAFIMKNKKIESGVIVVPTPKRVRRRGIIKPKFMRN